VLDLVAADEEIWRQSNGHEASWLVHHDSEKELALRLMHARTLEGLRLVPRGTEDGTMVWEPTMAASREKAM
jgi:hypothetical protein